MLITIIKADITTIEVDAIVNSANKSLMAGSGVCGIIHRVAGIKLEQECKEIAKKYPKGLSVGQSVITKAYNLPAKFVIHTVGPRKGRDDINLLEDCYINAMLLADKYNCKTISFPAISTNIYGVSINESAKLVKQAFEKLPTCNIEKVFLVMYNDEDFEVYRMMMLK
jgi:O-acetyl-ADP-ribose deacetylase